MQTITGEWYQRMMLPKFQTEGHILYTKWEVPEAYHHPQENGLIK